MNGVLEDLKTGLAGLLFIVVLFWLSSCANPMAPTGGAKDEIAPQILESSPRNKSVSVKPQNVSLRFNEYFVLDNPSQNITISPLVEGALEYIVKGKTLLIKLPKTPLQENTTYTINFGAALKDNNEGNIQDSFTYVFSTGLFLDSLSFTGNVNNALTSVAEEGFVVGLYKEAADSIVFTRKPDYYTKTKKDGSFRLENLKEGKYKLFAFKDENFSFTRDLSNENYAFHDSLVSPSENPMPIFLKSFEEKKPISVEDINSKNIGVFQFVMSEPIQSFMVSGFEKTIGLQDTAYVFNEKRDTILLYSTHSINKADSFVVLVNNIAIDTFLQSFKYNTIDSIKTLLPPLGLFTALLASTKKGLGGGNQNQGVIPQDYEAPLSIKLNRPIKNIQAERIKILEDSIQKEIPFSIKIDNKIGVLFHVEQPEKIRQGVVYEIAIGDSAFVDFYELYNEAFNIKYKTTKKDEYGESIITIDSIENDKQYIMQLLNTNDKIVAEEYIKDALTKTYKYKKLTPGDYKLKLIEDNNGNKKWDTGNYLTREQPEKIFIFPEKIAVRANWENEVVFKMNTMKPKKKILEKKDGVEEGE